MAEKFNEEELNSALEGAEELDNLTRQEMFDRVMANIEEVKKDNEEAKRIEAERIKVANAPKIGNYVQFNNPDHNNEFGEYNTIIMARDAAQNMTSYTIQANIDLIKPIISNIICRIISMCLF